MDNTKEPVAPVSTESNRWANVKEVGFLIKWQWPKYLVDILVIILSITISFTFDRFNEESSRSATEQAYLKSLLDDISSDINRLNEVIAASDRVVEKAKWLLTLTDNSEKIDMKEFSAALRGAIERPNFLSKDATFSDLTSSGNILLLEDMSLKTMLFEYHGLCESIRSVEISERETVNTSIAPYLMRNFSIKGLMGNGTVAHQGVNVNQIVLTDNFSNVISLRSVLRSELLDGYRQELSNATKIKARLSKAID